MKWILCPLVLLAVACANNQSASSGGASTQGAPTEPTPPPPGVPSKTGPRFERVIWIVLENTDYSGAMKTPILKVFADQGIQFDNLQAEAHPSQGNYIGMIAGGLLGVNNDNNFDLPASEKHLGDLLETRGYDWRVYAEGYPGNCFLGARAGAYVRKHVPFLSFLNVTQSPQRCAKIVNASAFLSDWANNRLPQFSMYIPDLNNDGHDTNVGFAAEWFQKTFGAGLRDPLLMEKTLIILTFDESEGYFGANKIYTAMMSPNLPSRLHIAGKHSHYSLLKFLEDEWNLGNLGRGDRTAPVITELQAPAN